MEDWEIFLVMEKNGVVQSVICYPDCEISFFGGVGGLIHDSGRLKGDMVCFFFFSEKIIM